MLVLTDVLRVDLQFVKVVPERFIQAGGPPVLFQAGHKLLPGVPQLLGHALRDAARSLRQEVVRRVQDENVLCLNGWKKVSSVSVCVCVCGFEGKAYIPSSLHRDR